MSMYADQLDDDNTTAETEVESEITKNEATVVRYRLQTVLEKVTMLSKPQRRKSTPTRPSQ